MVDRWLRINKCRSTWSGYIVCYQSWEYYMCFKFKMTDRGRQRRIPALRNNSYSFDKPRDYSFEEFLSSSTRKQYADGHYYSCYRHDKQDTINNGDDFFPVDSMRLAFSSWHLRCFVRPAPVDVLVQRDTGHSSEWCHCVLSFIMHRRRLPQSTLTISGVTVLVNIFCYSVTKNFDKEGCAIVRGS